MDKRLDGKGAIVTGAGQTPGDTIANGRAISILFARAGAKTMLVDLRLGSAQETQSMIEREGGESIALAADVSHAEDCQRMAEKCAETYGRIDILVNNVGIGGEDRGPVELKEEVWDRIFQRNLKRMFLTCKYVLPYMEKQGGGFVVISAGFKETGHEGALLEQQLVEIGKTYGMRIQGPNCLGLISTSTPLNLSFASGIPRKGKIGFISQSGALGTAVLDWA